MRITAMRPAVIVLVLIFCAGVQAQSTAPRREDPLQTKLQKAMQLEMLEAALNRRPASATDRNAVLSQVKEDFWRIQLANDDLNRFSSNSAEIDSRLIAKTASEIRTRAKRLKENLALPRPKNYDVVQSQSPDLRSSIITLSKLIESFVGNPMLSQKHVVDADLSLKASRDLDDIINLSGWIKKIATN